MPSTINDDTIIVLKKNTYTNDTMNPERNVHIIGIITYGYNSSVLSFLENANNEDNS